MYKIAVVDDDESWCFAIKSFFQKSFEITTFKQVPYSLHELVDYDLLIVDYSMSSTETHQNNVYGIVEIIRFFKNNFVNYPLLVITSDFIDKKNINNAVKVRELCSEADALFPKNVNLEELLQETLHLLASKKQNIFERSQQLIHALKPMYTMAVVDDDRQWCFAIDRFFKNEFEVYTFPTASDFLKQSFDFDLVIVDYSIPHLPHEDYMPSPELIRYLKSLRYPPLVVLVSGYVSKNDSALGKKICPEADAFFPKDAGLDELLRKIKDLLLCKR